MAGDTPVVTTDSSNNLSPNRRSSAQPPAMPKLGIEETRRGQLAKKKGEQTEETAPSSDTGKSVEDSAQITKALLEDHKKFKEYLETGKGSPIGKEGAPEGTLTFLLTLKNEALQQSGKPALTAEQVQEFARGYTALTPDEQRNMAGYAAVLLQDELRKKVSPEEAKKDIYNTGSVGSELLKEANKRLGGIFEGVGQEKITRIVQESKGSSSEGSHKSQENGDKKDAQTEQPNPSPKEPSIVKKTFNSIYNGVAYGSHVLYEEGVNFFPTVRGVVSDTFTGGVNFIEGAGLGTSSMAYALSRGVNSAAYDVWGIGFLSKKSMDYFDSWRKYLAKETEGSIAGAIGEMIPQVALFSTGPIGIGVVTVAAGLEGYQTARDTGASRTEAGVEAGFNTLKTLAFAHILKAAKIGKAVYSGRSLSGKLVGETTTFVNTAGRAGLAGAGIELANAGSKNIFFDHNENVPNRIFEGFKEGVTIAATAKTADIGIRASRSAFGTAKNLFKKKPTPGPSGDDILKVKPDPITSPESSETIIKVKPEASSATPSD